MSFAKSFVKGIETLKSVYNTASGDWMLNGLGQPQRRSFLGDITDHDGMKIYDDTARDVIKGVSTVMGGGIGLVIGAAAVGSGVGLSALFFSAAFGAGIALAGPNAHALISATSYGTRKLYASGIKEITAEKEAAYQARIEAERLANDNSAGHEQELPATPREYNGPTGM